MKKICISKDWLFSEWGGKAQSVDLPHDFAISKPRNPNRTKGESNGFFDGGVGVYGKCIRFEKNEHVILDIDGAYMCAQVKLNENILATHPNGFMPYLVDLTDRIAVGKLNKIEIRTFEQQPSCRWYSGAGVYRDVFLWTGGAVRIEPWDLFVTTLSAASSEAVIQIKGDISADCTQDVSVSFSVRLGKEEAAAFKERIHVVQNKKTHIEKQVSISNPKLWEIGQGNLYTLAVCIEKDGVILDEYEQTFGIRTAVLSAARGLEINGKTVKLRGGCIHHDHGALGAAAFPAAERRKVKLLKEAGFNALRIAHNPPSLALLEICDREGMVVLDEAFDCWNVPKFTAPSGYHLWFRDWWERDLSYMVMRDRSHPCVFAYSIGNEVPESDGQSDGAAWAKKLADHVRSLDNTRPVNAGICGFWDVTNEKDPKEYNETFLKKYKAYKTDDDAWARCTAPFMEALDLVGYNYYYPRYEKDGKAFPNRVIFGSETHVLHFYKSWHETLRLSHVIGDFTWTAIDNMGEVGTGRSCWSDDGVIYGITLAEFPWRTCYQGDLDLCGYRRPQSYFREAVWIGNIEPKIFTTDPARNGQTLSGTGWHWYDVSDTWTYPDSFIGKPVTVEVYTDADEILFELNGKEAGRAKPQEGIARTAIPYEKGTLVAKAVKNGKITKTSALSTVGEAEQIKIVPEQKNIAADNRDLAYFEIYVTDKNGQRVPHACHEISAFAEGGELMCVFSGNPKNEDDYASGKCHAFEGRALAVVRANRPGSVYLTVYGKGLNPCRVKIDSI